MSASPMARQITETKSIPIRRIAVNDPSELPNDYSATPGGTLYSTTPGGTKIVYEKSFLMNLRNSPISRTPPNCGIPDFLQKSSNAMRSNGVPSKPKPKTNQKKAPLKIDKLVTVVDDGQEQFQLDM